MGSAAFSGVLARVISAFRSTNPDVELHLYELGIREQMDGISNQSLDAGFLRLPIKPWPADLSSIGLLSEPIVLAIPSSHLLAKRKAVRSLAKESFIAMQHREGVGFDVQVEAICRRNGFVPALCSGRSNFRQSRAW
jgi:DNA-binding transcriptional LysR family regulator